MWATVLVAAEKWGIAPWTIAGGNELTWFLRWMAYESERTRDEARRING